LAPVQKKELAPGDSTVVELIFNTKTSKGKINKNARIMSNDSTRSSVTIDFAGNITISPDTISLIRLAPEQLQFAKSAKKAAVNIENHGGSQIKLSMVGVPSDNIKLKSGDAAIEGGSSKRLEFEWKGKTPEYDVGHVLTFETGDLSVSRLSIPYTIKGEKGPKPGPVSAHSAAKPANPVINPAKPSGPENKPAMGNQKGKSDSTKTVNPLPGTPWPPK
jgi:hypothetical protein